MVWPCKIQQSRFVALQHQSAPGTLKSSVLLALAQSLVLQAPCQSHVPLVQQIVHCAVSCLSCCQHGWFHLLSLGDLPSWQEFNHTLAVRDVWFLGPHLEEPVLVILPCLVSLDGVWAEPSSMWSQLCMASCALQWNHTLQKLACQLLLESRTFTVLFSSKEDDFCMTLGLAAGWPTCCCWCCCASVLLTTNHRPHIGCQFFLVAGFTTPRGSSCTAPTAVDRTWKQYG